MSLGSEHTGTGGPTESEDAIRHLKASQSVEAAFHGAGFPSPPGDVAALITNFVKSAVKSLPISQIANMSPGSGVLAAAALAGVDQFVSSLTPTQREAVRKGVNPLDAAAMLKFGGELNQLLNGKAFSPNGSMGDSRSSSPDAGTRATDSSVFRGDLGAFSQKNYAGSVFEQKGMSFSTFDALRKDKFDGNNIIHAAEDAKQHGFDPNNVRIAKDFAILDQDDGKRREERNRLMDEFQAKMNRDEELKRLKSQYESETDPEKKAVIAGQYHTRGKQISRESGFRSHIDTMPTERAKKAGDELEHEQIDKTLKGNINDLSHGNKAEAARIVQIVAEYRRHPQDAAARQNYEALKQHAEGDHRSKQAMAGIDRNISRNATNLKAIVTKNEITAVKNNVKEAKNEIRAEQVSETKSAKADLFASMTGETPATVKTAKADNKLAEVKAASAEPRKPDQHKPAQKVKVAGAPAPSA